LSHVQQIKIALGIAGVYTEQSSWRGKNLKEGKGAQIDLLIERSDYVTNICEIKFSKSPFTISKKYAEKLKNKIHAVQDNMKNKQTLFLTLITTFGLVENQYSISLVQNSITMDALFADN